MSAKKIILYDLPSRSPCKTWSLNPWKIRLALNYKGIPYTTEWVEYPDLKDKFTAVGIKPNDTSTGMREYTSPTVMLPDGSYIMESMSIVKHLEKEHPSPSLHLDSPYLQRISETVPKILGPLQPVFFPIVPKDILPERSSEYFRRTREQQVGMKLEEFETCERGGETAWKNARPHLETVAGMLKENGDGPFFMGKEVSYADFVFVGLVRMMERIQKLENLKGAVGKEDSEILMKQYEACGKWLERDGH